MLAVVAFLQLYDVIDRHAGVLYVIIVGTVYYT